MKIKRFPTSLSLGLMAMVLAACGTIATPVPDAVVTEEAAQALNPREDGPVAQLPTATPTLEPTFTPEPTATSQPTSTPEPTATEEAADSSAAGGDQITLLVSRIGSAERGMELYNTIYDAADGNACSTCHYVDSEEQLQGPGLLNIADRAPTRVEGESAAQYLYTSIVNPQAYIVEGYPENLMPQVYGEIFTDPQIYDLIAYLLTLQD
jgi:cytochrome c2